jgi:hypothetical protein
MESVLALDGGDWSDPRSDRFYPCSGQSKEDEMGGACGAHGGGEGCIQKFVWEA